MIEAVKVKPLAWDVSPKDEFTGDPRTHYGFGAFSHYHVAKENVFWNAGTFDSKGHAVHLGYHNTLTEAKAAAQSDYETRIRSALGEAA